MRTSQERRAHAIEAIEQVRLGGKADGLEDQWIDFKEENGTRSVGGTRVQIDPKSAAVASTLAQEAACMANTEDGGVLVVGVDDKKSGLNAFVGAQSDGEWLRERIWTLTQPHLAVEVEEIDVFGARLLLINVPDALQEVTVDSKLRTRRGDKCVELTGDQSRQFLESRRKFDWTAEASGMHLSDVIPEAMLSAREHYRAENGEVPTSGRELLNRLGVLRDNETNPELTVAGALLFCEYETEVEQISTIVTDAEGVASHHKVRGSAPILPLFDKTMDMLRDVAFPAKRKVIGTQRTSLRPIPEVVLRESMINAIMHRDYRTQNAHIVASASGIPPNLFKVSSPGGLVEGVSITRLIATSSKPRNPALAEALRVLGLAEKEGVGIDTIYREMMREGHPEPEITEQDGRVLIRLVGGAPDIRALEFFDELGRRYNSLRGDVRVVMAVIYLTTHPTIRPENLSTFAQCLPAEAARVLEQLQDIGYLERVLNRSLSFRLTSTAIEKLGGFISIARRSTTEEQTDLINSYLDFHVDIGRTEVAKILTVTLSRASKVLTKMLTGGLLEYAGPKMGRNVRYRKPTHSA